MAIDMAQKQTLTNWLQISSLRLTRVRFVLLAIFVVNTIADDAWHLIPSMTAMDRWVAIGAVGFVNTVLWYASRNNVKSEMYYKTLIYIQVLLDILVVSLLIFSQRGIASRAVMLYTLPLIGSAVLLTRSAIYATAALCVSAYTIAIMRYQYLHPSEGYKIELYGELFFYGAAFFIVAALLQILIRPKK